MLAWGPMHDGKHITVWHGIFGVAPDTACMVAQPLVPLKTPPEGTGQASSSQHTSQFEAASAAAQQGWGLQSSSQLCGIDAAAASAAAMQSAGGPPGDWQAAAVAGDPDALSSYFDFLSEDLLLPARHNMDPATLEAVAAAAVPAGQDKPAKRAKREVCETYGDGSNEDDADGSDDDEEEPRKGGGKRKATAAQQNKANREKARREKINDRFMELAKLVEPGQEPKTDKLSVLQEAIRCVQQMQVENSQLKQLNKFMEEKVGQLEKERAQMLYQMYQMSGGASQMMGHMMPGSGMGMMPHPMAHMAAAAAGPMPPMGGMPGPPLPHHMPPQHPGVPPAAAAAGPSCMPGPVHFPPCQPAPQQQQAAAGGEPGQQRPPTPGNTSVGPSGSTTEAPSSSLQQQQQQQGGWACKQEHRQQQEQGSGQPPSVSMPAPQQQQQQPPPPGLPHVGPMMPPSGMPPGLPLLPGHGPMAGGPEGMLGMPGKLMMPPGMSYWGSMVPPNMMDPVRDSLLRPPAA